MTTPRAWRSTPAGALPIATKANECAPILRCPTGYTQEMRTLAQLCVLGGALFAIDARAGVPVSGPTESVAAATATAPATAPATATPPTAATVMPAAVANVPPPALVSSSASLAAPAWQGTLRRQVFVWNYYVSPPVRASGLVQAGAALLGLGLAGLLSGAVTLGLAGPYQGAYRTNLGAIIAGSSVMGASVGAWLVPGAVMLGVGRARQAAKVPTRRPPEQREVYWEEVKRPTSQRASAEGTPAPPANAEGASAPGNPPLSRGPDSPGEVQIVDLAAGVPTLPPRRVYVPIPSHPYSQDWLQSRLPHAERAYVAGAILMGLGAIGAIAGGLWLSNLPRVNGAVDYQSARRSVDVIVISCVGVFLPGLITFSAGMSKYRSYRQYLSEFQLPSDAWIPGN